MPLAIRADESNLRSGEDLRSQQQKESGVGLFFGFKGEFLSHLIGRDPGVRAIAERSICCLFALAEVGLTIGFCGEGLGCKTGALVRTVAEWLAGRLSAGAEVVGFSGFEFDRDGLVVGDSWFVHGEFKGKIGRGEVSEVTKGRTTPGR